MDNLIIEKKYKVLIMMATYNGEKYVAEQIESIINQSYKNWELIIQDDGSTDNTCLIIGDYIKCDSRISLIINKSRFHGPYCNFYLLIDKCKHKVKYDYYMFADQDDIWNNDKIEREIKEIKRIEKGKPALVYTDLSICDENCNIKHQSLFKYLKKPDINKTNPFFVNTVNGCTMIINYDLFQRIPHIDLNQNFVEKISHDNFIARYAFIYGNVERMKISTIRYRRHSNNYTKHKTYKITISAILRRLLDMNGLAKSHAVIYNQCLFAINNMLAEDISYKLKKKLNDYKILIINGGVPTLFFVIKNKICWGRIYENISRCVVLTLGLHKKYLINF